MSVELTTLNILNEHEITNDLGNDDNRVMYYVTFKTTYSNDKGVTKAIKQVFEDIKTKYPNSDVMFSGNVFMNDA